MFLCDGGGMCGNDKLAVENKASTENRPERKSRVEGEDSDKEALRRGEERYRRLFEGLRETMVVMKVVRDENGTIIDWIIQAANPEATRNCPMESIIGLRASEVFGELIRPHIEMSNELTKGERVERFEAHFPWNDRHYLASMFALDQETIVVSTVDITDRKRLENALQQACDTLENTVRERTAELLASNEQLRQRTEQLSRLANELMVAEQRERHRLAVVLHEHLQQLLVGAKLKLGMIARSRNRNIRGQAEETSQMLAECIDTTRSLAAEICPPVLRRNGLAAAFDWLARWMADKHGLTVTVESDGVDDLASENVREMLFHAVRELLFNIVKHAQVDQAAIHVQQLSRRVLISISDKGVGFDAARQDQPGADARGAGGFGLFSIRERVESIGGRMEIQSRPGEGTRVCMSIPLDVAAVTA